MERCQTRFTSSSPEETEAFGRRFAGFLKPGSLVALYGCLGSGKTCLVKGIARGLGIKEIVTSPTFTILSEYTSGRTPLYHIDAYRLGTDDDFENTGLGEYIGSNGITVIEWSELIPRSVPNDAIKIIIEITGAQNRLLQIEGLETT
jgi:tRNA threonylcarbamoyladenosine biosynthesis protein TsaE